MEISIELLAIGLPVLFGLAFMGLLTLIKYLKLWRYKPENDKGYIGEQRRIAELGNLSGITPPQRRSVFQTPTFDGTRSHERNRGDEVSSPTGPSKSVRKPRRNPFKRR